MARNPIVPSQPAAVTPTPNPTPNPGAPLPANEALRLQTLQLCRILDTESEGAFDDLVALAATICDAPIALISLVDESRQWFKAKVGLDVAETSRDVAFCAHAILGSDVMVVGDATKDPRFASNPLVTGAPNIRFYAGAPIVTSQGTALGTVCVIDRKPRTLTPMQEQALRLLRQTAGHLIELRRARLDLDAVSKLLPLCSWCRSVRTDSGQWVDLHRYVSDALPVTHSMCPDCLRKEFDEMSAAGS